MQKTANRLENKKRWKQAMIRARIEFSRSVHDRVRANGGRRFKKGDYIYRGIGIGGAARVVGQKNVARVTKKIHLSGYHATVKELANSYYQPLPTR